MHLTLHADYALRVLLYLAVNPDRVISTGEVSGAYGISKHHLVRVVQGLGRHGFVEVRPGRSGGVVLARAPAEISVGEVVRRMEPDFHIVECFDPKTNTCPITPACGLIGVLNEATRAFLATLDKYTLEDLVRRSPRKLSAYFLKPAANAEVG
ncbi:MULTISPECIES: RrF2 family transcriptional regulator [Archangium]|uniref:BadM/Rrf2 family transcriptional regulator n=1 Tax=Archangium violaceum Cb vi76 TaxID=1406225 RepID=A0A084SGB9_9BACT|nr:MULTISPECIES: Rrf2 family transcriptional regulator [Archangium]KFA87504.1 BadM/Rrf2 family transcriptional regulator [Archangium violaceum Cb vi76]OJT17267.1 BadM/Rrf2 family transcriptional regulator [Archangium sp. Cb G35]WNG61653.1 Rrf2 family transcriptional regulator [Archangium gephyra]